MESSRRVFTNEFKLAAVRRLEQAVSIAVVAVSYTHLCWACQRAREDK